MSVAIKVSCSGDGCKQQAHLLIRKAPRCLRGMQQRARWHVDHIRPCASFDLTDKKQQLVCFNWRNLRPMWGAENISKSDNYDPADEVEWAYMMRELGYEGELFLLFEEGRGGLYGQESAGEVDT